MAQQEQLSELEDPRKRHLERTEGLPARALEDALAEETSMDARLTSSLVFAWQNDPVEEHLPAGWQAAKTIAKANGYSMDEAIDTLLTYRHTI